MRLSGFLKCNRGDGTRTHGLCVPNAALYQTEPRLDATIVFYQTTNILSRLFWVFLKLFWEAFRNHFEHFGGGEGVVIWSNCSSEICVERRRFQLFIWGKDPEVKTPRTDAWFCICPGCLLAAIWKSGQPDYFVFVSFAFVSLVLPSFAFASLVPFVFSDSSGFSCGSSMRSITAFSIWWSFM